MLAKLAILACLVALAMSDCTVPSGQPTECDPYMPDQVFIDPGSGLTLAALNAIAATSIASVNALPASSCLTIATELACTTIYSNCLTLGTSTFPAHPCRDVCTNFTEQCGQLYTLAGVADSLFNCSAKSQLYPGQDLYPVSGNNVAPGVTAACVPTVLDYSTLPNFFRCEDFSAAASPGCAAYISGSIFLPGGLSQAAVNAVIAPNLAATAALPATCQPALQDLICRTAFSPCVPVTPAVAPIPSTFNFPSYPCRNTCNRTVDQCGQLLAISLQDPFDCDAVDSAFGVPQYPHTANTYGALSIPCTDSNIADSLASSFACEDYPGDDAFSGPNDCDDFIDYPVFTANAVGTTMDFLVASAEAALAGSEALPDYCRVPLQQLICTAAFMRCDTVDSVDGVALPTTFFMPRQACQDTCEVAADQCTAALSVGTCGASSPPDCDVTTSLIGTVPQYPDDEVSRPIRIAPGNSGIVNIDTECHEGSATIPSEPEFPECIDFDAGDDHVLVQCNRYITGPVFEIQPGNYSSFQRESARQRLRFFSLASRKCQREAVKFVCTAAFPPCYNLTRQGLDLATTFVPVCNSVCRDFVDACEDFLIDRDQPVTDCDATNPSLNGQKSFPDDYHVYNLSDCFTTNVTCNDFSGESSSSEDKIRCVYPFHPTYVKDEPCDLECLLAIFSDKEYEDFWITLLVLFWIGIVCIVLTMLPYTIRAEMRRFPHTLTAFFTFSFFIFYLGLIWPTFSSDPSFGGWEDVLCDQGIYADQSHAACGWQAFCQQFGLLAASCWYMVMNLSLFAHIVLRVKWNQGEDHVNLVRVIFHIYGWGVPLLTTILGFAFDKMGAGPGSFSCWITTDDDMEWIIGLFLVPLLFNATVGLLMSCAIIFRLFRAEKNVFKAISQQGRFFVWVGFFQLASWVITARILDGRVNLDDIQDSIEEWAACELADASSCTFDTRPSLGLQWAAMVTGGIIGPVTFILFGLAPPQQPWWKNIFRRMVGKEPLDTGTLTGKTSHSSTTATMSLSD